MSRVNSVLFVSILLSQNVLAKTQVVYGEDNRVDVYEANSTHQKWSRSVVTMIAKKEFSSHPQISNHFQVSQQTLNEWLQLPPEGSDEEVSSDDPNEEVFQVKPKNKPPACEGMRFADQPNPGMCTGFLIAPDLIVTAGHCTELENVCRDYNWVFDFKEDKATKTSGLDVKSEDIYSCKRVVTSALSVLLGLDYGIIQLDRPVAGREPFEIRSEGLIKDKEALVVIGNPNGLPMKVSDHANVRDNTHPFFFSSNLDTFTGNSGSPVFNANSGTIEGILVRGENDYIYDAVNDCMLVNVCPDGECRGEDVSRMTSIPEVTIQKALNMASAQGNLTDLTKILQMKTWLDFRGKDGQTALMKAAANGKDQAIQLLLANKADVTIKDANGNTALHHLANAKTVTKTAVDLLLKAGANLDSKNNSSETPLMVATKNKNRTLVKLLKAAEEVSSIGQHKRNIFDFFKRP